MEAVTPIDEGTAAPLVPRRRSLPALRQAAAGCRACPLWLRGTQTVFGEGTRNARLMLVGEQPGDKEDLAGKPFVGPAGRLLDQAIAESGASRKDIYVTNVVKHFKWIERGKRRLHQKPNAREITACRPWLEGEIDVVQPQVLICLGATAAKSLLGAKFRVLRDRGRFFESDMGPLLTATAHPSSILRTDDREEREIARRAFFADIAAAVDRLS